MGLEGKEGDVMMVENTRPESTTTNKKTFDPELLYIECSQCGRALNWERGETSAFVNKAGISLSVLDSSYMIYSVGCPACTPDQLGYFTKLVQVAEKRKGSTS